MKQLRDFRVLKNKVWEPVSELEWWHSLYRRSAVWGPAGQVEYHGPVHSVCSELFSMGERECRCSACTILEGGVRPGFESVFAGMTEEV